MQLQFTKMHGIGNDFMLVDATHPQQAELLLAGARENAVYLCDRRFGVGADGVILALPSPDAQSDFRMMVINSDGSEPEMCGNGLRCFAKFVHDRGLMDETTLRVLTGRGVLKTESSVSRGRVQTVQVDMGEPILARADVPAALPGDPFGPVIDEELIVDGHPHRVTCISMGNPHCVVFVDGEIDEIPLSSIGPKFEHHPLFPHRINTEFVQVLGPGEFKMRVWERGAGETLACGTGACAVIVAGSLTGKLAREAVGHLAGGDLSLEWTQNGPVLMTGSATEVFTGVIDLPK